MSWTVLRRAFGRGLLLAVLAVLATPSLAQAKWLRAESNHFIVYSNGDERSLRIYAQTLEAFDSLLRRLHGLGEVSTARKLPVYLLGSARDLKVIVDLPANARGVYLPAGEDIFAAAISQGRQDDFMLHEYVHHFMLANYPYAYPPWLVEGYAEYFMTFTVDDQYITWGQYHPVRAAWLTGASWIPTATLLTAHGGSLRKDREVAQFYAQSWALTHYFMASPERRRQLDAYVKAVGAGVESQAAMRTATGMSTDALHQALKDYVKGELIYSRVSASQFPTGPVAITVLPPSAEDLLLLAQRLKVGARGDDQRAALAEKVRRAAAKHPGDAFAMVTLGHAELHFGDVAAGERVLMELLAREPDHVEALQLMASARLRAAPEAATPAEAKTLRAQARGFLARAYKVDDLNYYTLYLLALSREPEADYPIDNDVATWLLAYNQAPQLPMIRVGAARALMMKGQFIQAIRILEPLANSPHGGALALAAQGLIARAREGKPPTETTTGPDDLGPETPDAPADGPKPETPALRMW